MFLLLFYLEINNKIKINENDIEKGKKNSDCVRNKKNKK